MIRSYLLQTFISAMVPMKGFLVKEYLPSITINSVVLAPVMMLLSNLPGQRKTFKQNIFRTKFSS